MMRAHGGRLRAPAHDVAEAAVLVAVYIVHGCLDAADDGCDRVHAPPLDGDPR